jgi:hypothetical protein
MKFQIFTMDFELPFFSLREFYLIILLYSAHTAHNVNVYLMTAESGLVEPKRARSSGTRA